MKRVVVIANKTWECDPLIGCLLNKEARPANLNTPSTINQRPPSQSDGNPPRLIYSLDRELSIEIWCLQDLLDSSKSSSSSEEKSRVIPIIRAYQNVEPSFVIAFGTAAFPKGKSYNGCVTIGTRCYIHNSHPNNENPKSNWIPPQPDTLLTTNQLAEQFVSQLNLTFRSEVQMRLLDSPVSPATIKTIVCSPYQTALSNVNVTDYAEYAWLDERAVESFRATSFNTELVSVETTHGVIRSAFEGVPFIFVSGISDEVGSFNIQVAPRQYSQNFVAAHNAGIAVAWLLPDIIQEFGKPTYQISSRHFFVEATEPSRNDLSLRGVISDMILCAEEWYGERVFPADMTILGPEFWPGGPRVEYYPVGNEKFAVVQLGENLTDDAHRMMLYYQLAEEVLHMLMLHHPPKQIEEGLSVVFARRYMIERHTWTPQSPNPNYRQAFEDVESLIGLDQDIMRRLRHDTPKLSELTAADIMNLCPQCPQVLADRLVSNF